jgi:hypothetical protein
MKHSGGPPKSTDPVKIEDEPGMEARFQRALRRALSTPPTHRTSPKPKAKERPALKGRVSKGRTRN